jgi:hypothetical protein
VIKYSAVGTSRGGLNFPAAADKLRAKFSRVACNSLGCRSSNFGHHRSIYREFLHVLDFLNKSFDAAQIKAEKQAQMVIELANRISKSIAPAAECIEQCGQETTP